MRDYHRALKGVYSVPSIFYYSSNIGIGKIALKIKRDKLFEYFKRLGLLDRLTLEIKELAFPIYDHKYIEYNNLQLVTMSYGYGIAISPIHFMQAMIPIVNGGLFHPLTLIKRDKMDLLNSKRVFQNQTSQDMKFLLKLVVEKGTGSKAKIKGYDIGGKTGTANISIDGTYNKSKRISSFFSVFPTIKPKYMIYIMYNEPNGISETCGFSGGGWVAAPSVKSIIKKLIILDNVK